MSSRDNLPVNLSYFLRKNKMTQRDVALLLGESEGLVSRWFRGLVFPRPGRLDDLAFLFNCSVARLLQGPKQLGDLSVRRKRK